MLPPRRQAPSTPCGPDASRWLARIPWLFAAVLVSSCCARPTGSSTPASTSSAAVSSVSPDASSASGWVAVPPRRLSVSGFFFHPSLPLAGQPRGDRCDVWDLDRVLYRGDVELSVCAGWKPSSPREVPLALTSHKVLLEGGYWNPPPPALAIDGPPTLPPDWSATSGVAYGAHQVDFAVPHCDIQRVNLEAIDARRHYLATHDILRGKHLSLAPAPDGKSAAWLVKTWEECPGDAESDRVSSTTDLHLLRWTTTGQLDEAWSVPTRGEVVAWSPTSALIAVVAEAHVTVLDATTGKVRSAWAGHAPLAWSPAGEQLAYADADGTLAVRRPDAGAARTLVPGVHALAWAAGTLAVATDEVVTLLAADSWRQERVIDLPDVGAIVADTPHARWLLRDGQQRVHVHDDGKTVRLGTTVAGATLRATAAGEVLVVEPARGLGTGRGAKVEPARVRRFVRAVSAWSEQAPVPLHEGESVDPSGRFTVTLRQGLGRVRRLADGEALNVDGEVAWTDRRAYEGQPDKAREPWVFRRGEVLSGTLVQGAEAAALAPRVPDLWTVFSSGAALPGL